MAKHRKGRGSSRAPGEYAVGYGKPPQEHRFQKNAPTPNPFGRRGKPKSDKSVEAADFLGGLITIGENGRPKKVTRFDKVARLLAQAARFEAGQVLLPRDAPWLSAYMGELLAFPTGSHDDQVDSTSQALRWLTSRQSSTAEQPRRDIERRNVARANFVMRR